MDAHRLTSLHERTAVYVDLLAGDVIAVRHQEEHRLGDFLGVSEATHRDLALDCCLRCRRNGVKHVGFSIAGAYRVDRNPELTSSAAAVRVKAMIPPLLAL